MTKYLLKISLFIGVLMVPLAGFSEAQSAEAAYELNAIGEIQITVKGNDVRIQNAQGESLRVYGITGKLISSTQIESNDETVNLNLTKGCYIVKVGKVARKIYIL